MDRNFYQRQDVPFATPPAPQALFVSPSQRMAVERILHGIRARQGLMALIGEAGLDKAMLLRSYLEKTDQQHLKILYVSNADISFDALIKHLYKGLKYDLISRNIPEIFSVMHLRTMFIEECENNFNLVIIIDNAHNMPFDTLKKLPLLTNLEYFEKNPLQIVLVGLPIFVQNLDRPALQGMKDTIGTISRMPRMEEKEGVEFIHSRPRHAPSMFTYGGQSHKNALYARLARRVIANFAGKSARLRFAGLAAVGTILLASLVAVLLRDHWRLLPFKMSAFIQHDRVVPIVEPRAVVKAVPDSLPAASTIHEEAFVATLRPAAMAPPPVAVIQQATALVHRFFPNGGAFTLAVRPDKGMDAVYTAGEKLLVDIVAARDAYLQVDYYQADGQVVHLLPHILADNRVEAGKTFTLGKPGDSFQFHISSPFGAEMLMVLASQQPLEAPQDAPSVEPASAYLQRLSRSLEEHRAQAQAAVVYTRIRTQEQVGRR